MKKSFCTAFAAIALTCAAQQHVCVNPYTGEAASKDTAPALEIFIPENPAGPAVVACPGGGYGFLAYDKEGADWADWLGERGIALAVLNYTLPKGNCQLPGNDAKAAISYLRENAAALKLDPEKIGIMGFSAGGHLASTAATHYDSAANRPSFQILVYPVISMDSTITHKGSRVNLLGENPTEGLVTLYSNEKQVKAGNPPAYIIACEDDRTVPVANSLRYFQALTDAGVPAEAHFFPTGGHGFGKLPGFKYVNSMLNTLSDWLADTAKK